MHILEQICLSIAEPLQNRQHAISTHLCQRMKWRGDGKEGEGMKGEGGNEAWVWQEVTDYNSSQKPIMCITNFTNVCYILERILSLILVIFVTVVLFWRVVHVHFSFFLYCISVCCSLQLQWVAPMIHKILTDVETVSILGLLWLVEVNDFFKVTGTFFLSIDLV